MVEYELIGLFLCPILYLIVGAIVATARKMFNHETFKVSYWWEVWQTEAEDGDPWGDSHSHYVDRYVNVDDAVRRMKIVDQYGLGAPVKTSVVCYSGGNHNRKLRLSRNNVVICG